MKEDIMQKGKGIVMGRCPKCRKSIAIDLINSRVKGGKFETVSDEKHKKVFITCPECGHREEELSLITNVV